MYNERPSLSAGQVWQYKARGGEEDSVAIILRTEVHPKLGPLVHIAIANLVGLNRKHPEWKGKFADFVAHLPFTADAVNSSLLTLLGMVEKLPPYEDGYKQWSSAVAAGSGGVFTVSIAQGVDFIEQSRSAMAKRLPDIQ